MLQRLAHIALAVLVFISSTGLVLSRHYCRDELKSLALFAKAKSCHEADPMAHCPVHGHAMPMDDERDCCDDEVDFLKVDDERQLSSAEWQPHLPLALSAVVAFGLPLEDQTAGRGPIPYLHYKPPLLVRDLPVRLQTFRC